MNILVTLSMTLTLLCMGCSEHVHDENCQSHGGYHVHKPLMGGELIPLGEHGSGYNLEGVTDESNRLSLYILDAHAENFVRINQSKLEVLLGEDNQSTVLKLDAVADSATGETVGNTSHFRTSGSITTYLPLAGTIKHIQIGTTEYNHTSITLSGNPYTVKP